MSVQEYPRLTREEYEGVRMLFGRGGVFLFVHMSRKVVLYEEDAWVGHFVWDSRTGSRQQECLMPMHPDEPGPAVYLFDLDELQNRLEWLVKVALARDVCVFLQQPMPGGPGGSVAYGWSLISRHIGGVRCAG